MSEKPPASEAPENGIYMVNKNFDQGQIMFRVGEMPRIELNMDGDGVIVSTKEGEQAKIKSEAVEQLVRQGFITKVG